MNKVVLVGRLTKDPELKKTNTDISYVQFTLAVNRLYQNKNGEKQADFISCIAWRTTAELLTKYIKKGVQIGIDGQIQTRTYDDQNGVKHYITEVVCDNVYFLEPKKADGQGDFAPYNDFNQGNQYNRPNNGNQNNKTFEKPFNQPNNSPYRGETNYRAPQKQESPFDDINSQFDISSDDLPF
jgi:single-strand DNA-binding protein